MSKTGREHSVNFDFTRNAIVFPFQTRVMRWAWDLLLLRQDELSISIAIDCRAATNKRKEVTDHNREIDAALSPGWQFRAYFLDKAGAKTSRANCSIDRAGCPVSFFTSSVTKSPQPLPYAAL